MLLHGPNAHFVCCLPLGEDEDTARNIFFKDVFFKCADTSGFAVGCVSGWSRAEFACAGSVNMWLSVSVRVYDEV
jgi:hypothetical protein